MGGDCFGHASAPDAGGGWFQLIGVVAVISMTTTKHTMATAREYVIVSAYSTRRIDATI